MDKLTSEHFNEEINHVSNNLLPIFKYKDEIIEAVRNHQFVIIHGQTGCGKTTQVPGFLLEDNLNNDERIGVTQPRKIAAVTIAKHVAKERKEPIGKTVGYEVRFDKKESATTKIKYMTDGILLNECMFTKNLKDYNIIMIDEAHERAVVSDVLLGILKKITEKRDDLKVIISSATISVEKFCNYFENAKVISVESRLYDVDVIYGDYCSDYIEKTVALVQEIHAREMKQQEEGGVTKGDILVFLTGQDEINTCCDELDKIEGVVAKALYSAIDPDNQQEVFDPVKPYETKVVVATNIAETSITIDGIKYVIDCGYVKQNRFNPKRGMEVLEDVRISKSQAEQRKGRAGRTQPGICYRLYSKKTYESLKDEAVPEIYRKNLSEICLKLRSFGVIPKDFQFIDSPTLEELGRCDEDIIDLSLMTRDGKLTSMGEKVAVFPLDPVLGKVLMISSSNNCLMDVVHIVPLISEKMNYVFKRPRGNAKIADSLHRKFWDPSGDHFTLLNVYNEWKQQKEKGKWCSCNFINATTMNGVEKIVKQLMEILKKGMVVMKESKGGRNDIKKSFVSGYFKNICIKQTRDNYTRLSDQETFYIHASSSLRETKPKIILFHSAMKSTKSFANGVMQLDENFLRDNFKKELKTINFPDDVNQPTSF